MFIQKEEEEEEMSERTNERVSHSIRLETALAGARAHFYVFTLRRNEQ